MTAKTNTPEELESIMNSETNKDGLKYKYNEAKMEIKEQKKRSICFSCRIIKR